MLPSQQEVNKLFPTVLIPTQKNLRQQKEENYFYNLQLRHVVSCPYSMESVRLIYVCIAEVQCSVRTFIPILMRIGQLIWWL
jgi:hypothetical protein